MKIEKIYNFGIKILKKAGITNYTNEIRWIIESEGIPFKEIIVNPNKKISFIRFMKIFKKILRRSNRYPLQYIFGEQEFLGLKFKINKKVLIPRPETEIIVKEAIKLIEPNKKVIDIGCGSGVIGISLKYYREDLDITMTDISKKALKVAKENINRILKNPTGIRLIYSNIFHNIKENFDAILSNPPYITEEEKKLLDPELKFEPSKALFCKNKTEFYEKILIEGLKHIKSKGIFIFELGLNTANEIEKLFKENKTIKENYKIDYFAYDGTGVKRVCVIRFLK